MAVVTAAHMIEVDCHISISRNGNCFLDKTKIELLYGVIHSGSLNKAARKLRISYQHAWNMIDEMNKSAALPLVIKKRGGANGGGAELSNYGMKIIREYKLIEEQVRKTINQINVEINF